jgi:hypothetical protein
MDFNQVIKKFDEIYERVSLEELRNLWIKDAKKVNVYVHSPFCESICKYCLYKGIKIPSQSVYDKYYFDYLPKSVNNFIDILEKKFIKLYFFGGGTPSLMTPEVMKHTFDLFPNFKENKFKIFEAHPSSLTEKQINILSDYNFGFVILGIQSFNSEVIKKQNRITYSYEKVKELVELIKSNCLKVSLDIICYVDGYEEKNLKDFENDLLLSLSLDPDEISLYTMSELNNDANYKCCQKEFTEKYLNVILKNFDKLKEYQIANFEEKEINLNNLYHDKIHCKTVKLYKKNIPVEEYYRFNSMVVEPCIAKNQKNTSVMGFGSLLNMSKNTYSVINDSEYEYIEVNNSWNQLYYKTYDKVDFFKECEMFLEKIKLLGEPPQNIIFNFTNKNSVNDKGTIFQKIKSLDFNISWDYLTKESREYLDRFKKLFSDWKWWDY